MNKFFTLILLISFNFSFAQNWQTVNSNRTALFSYDGFFEGDSAKIYEGLRIDSIAIEGADSLFFNYTTFYDDGNNCELDDTSWIGTHVRIDSLGNNYFHSKYGDTFLIKTLADSGEVWNFYDSITAKVDTIIFEPLFDSIQDSIKVIVLSNGDEIQISKNYGLTKGFRFGYYPNDISKISLRGIKGAGGVQNLTSAEIFDFEIGDVFHFKYEKICDYPPESYYYESYGTILNISSQYQINDFRADSLPYESSVGFLQNYFKKDTMNQKLLSTRCPHAYVELSYAKGLGNFETFIAEEGTGCRSHKWLVYYKKVNGEEWGIPLAKNELIQSQISIYPNPTTDILNISNENETLINIEIYSPLGKLLLSEKGKSNYQINTSAWQKGMYFLQVKNSKGEVLKLEKIILG